MAKYIHERRRWPKFRWDQRDIAKQLAAVRHRQGRLIGRMQALGFPLRAEAVLTTLTEDVLKSSEIEGEILDAIRCARRSRAVLAWTRALCRPPTAMSKAWSR